MNQQLQKIVNDVKDQMPKAVEENKGALLGAVVGWLLTDNKQAQSSIIGAIAGSLLVDKKKDEE